MKVGTRSALYGVHSWWFHWLPVGLAWRHLYGSWPRWHEWIAIFFHDFPGYWGCSDMDGECGRNHPQAGAWWAGNIVHIFDSSKMNETYNLARGHSRVFAAMQGIPVSKLCAADKASIFFTPEWLYLLQAHASGEIFEYRRNAPLWVQHSSLVWLAHYKQKTKAYIDSLNLCKIHPQ